MTTVDLRASTSTAAPRAAVPREPRRGAARFLLDVLNELGRRPSIWDPWLLLTPHRARAVRRTGSTPR
jgi:hypothetical protein